jgi:hypothetical protein
MYLGAIVNQSNAIEEDIKEKIIAGNKIFLCKPKNVSK